MTKISRPRYCPTMLRKKRYGDLAANGLPLWHTEPCDAPLYYDETVCEGCASGGKSPGRYPVGKPPAQRYRDDPFGEEG